MGAGNRLGERVGGGAAFLKGFLSSTSVAGGWGRSFSDGRGVASNRLLQLFTQSTSLILKEVHSNQFEWKLFLQTFVDLRNRS